MHFGDVAPQTDGSAIPVWVRDGWEVEEKTVLNEARAAGDSTAVVYGYIPKKMAEELKPGAAKAVRRALLIEAIAEKEGLQPSEADVEAEVERLARSSQRPAPAVRSMLERSGDLERLRISLMEKRTLDFLIERATIAP